MSLDREGFISEGPLREWIRRGLRAERADNVETEKKREALKGPAHNRLLHARQFLLKYGWPKDETVPTMKASGRSLGPGQWWRVIGVFFPPSRHHSF